MTRAAAALEKRQVTSEKFVRTRLGFKTNKQVLVLSECVCVYHEVQLSLVRSEDRPKPGVGVTG